MNSGMQKKTPSLAGGMQKKTPSCFFFLELYKIYAEHREQHETCLNTSLNILTSYPESLVKKKKNYSPSTGRFLFFRCLSFVFLVLIHHTCDGK